MAEAKKTGKKQDAKGKKEIELNIEASAESKAPKIAAKNKVAKPKTAAKASDNPVKPLAKSGKRSARAQKEADTAKAKQERKAEAKDSADTPAKAPVKSARSRAERAGKKYKEALKQIDKTKTYALDEAIDLAIKTSTVKFDATLEMHFNLGVDSKLADQNIRGTVSLPSGSGWQIKIAVFAEGADAEAAKKAGADKVGGDDFLAELDKEQINFESLITTPALMQRLAKYAKLLGPRGLMPNPKSGTVTTDIAKAVTEAKAGKVEYRTDQSGIVHLGIGKVSQGKDKLQANADVVVAAIKSAKPASLKGIYLKSAYITSTMGPSIRISL